MILFHTPGSPYARIVRMLWRERGPAMEECQVALRTPDSPLLAHHPVGRVPALRDGAALISETLLILDHCGWLPGDAPARARLGQVMGLLDGIAVWNRELRRVPGERSPGVLALEAARADRALAALDPAAHDPASVEGIALACLLGYGERRHRAWDWRRANPALAPWFEAAAVRPAFQATLPPVSGI
ncbi:MAG: glutathione S-transferase [Rubritepida sp.]|nr:glutathione S-transferase [Rubritepida sp.]